MVSFHRKAVGTLFLILLPTVGLARSSLPKALVRIGQLNISVEIPDTPFLQHKGLGQRDYLPEFAGMLFIFATPDIYSFHMKDMRFPIDIIWIRANLIVDISKNVPVPTGSRLPTFTPRTKADMVLEVNAHFTDHHNIGEGNRVEIHPLK